MDTITEHFSNTFLLGKYMIYFAFVFQIYLVKNVVVVNALILPVY